MELHDLLPQAVEWLSTCWKWAKAAGIPKALKEHGTEYIQWVKDLFKGHKNAEDALEKLEQDAEDKRMAGKLEGYLESLLEKEPALLQSLPERLKQLEAAQQQYATLTTSGENNRVVNAQNITNSTIQQGDTFTQTNVHGDNIGGNKIVNN